MSTTLLELTDVQTYYGKIHALKGVSLHVDQGEIVTLIGSNGAGKSTTLRTISGLVRPRTGDVKLKGKSIVGVPAHQIVAEGLGHVPEGRGVFPGLTVLEMKFTTRVPTWMVGVAEKLGLWRQSFSKYGRLVEAFWIPPDARTPRFQGGHA